MPRQNRVTPFGTIVATAARGTLMGNRGVLHDDEGRIVRPWRLKRWILCWLQFKGRRRAVMTPGRYTELFFLDEPTGLAAGHRPCAECQRDRFNTFRRAWQLGNGMGEEPVSATALDERLHAERLTSGGSKRTYAEDLSVLPDGVLVSRASDPDSAWLVWRGNLLLWAPEGYRDRIPRPPAEQVSVLTPRSIVAALRAGYPVEAHPSQRQLCHGG